MDESGTGSRKGSLLSTRVLEAEAEAVVFVSRFQMGGIATTILLKSISVNEFGHISA